MRIGLGVQEITHTCIQCHACIVSLIWFSDGEFVVTKQVVLILFCGFATACNGTCIDIKPPAEHDGRYLRVSLAERISHPSADKKRSILIRVKPEVL